MLQPVPASLLLSQDPRILRLRAQNGNALFSTGCRELDAYVLLAGVNGAAAGSSLGGGFQPGSVVGISSEEEDTIGLGVGLQVIARMFLLSSSDGHSTQGQGQAKAMGKEANGQGKGKAMIITTLSTTSLLPRLRLALVSEARALQQETGSVQAQVDRAKIKSCLERVLVARVFDAEGLREVLRELDADTTSTDETGLKEKKGKKQQHHHQHEGEEEREKESAAGGKTSKEDDNHLPSLILITNTSHLLNTLFTHHHGNKTGSDRSRAAHNSAVELSNQIRALSKKGPLVMFLNSTTSHSGSGSMLDDNRGPKQPDLSIMRSIFNPPPPLPALAALEGAPPGLMARLHAVGHSAGANSGSYNRGGHHQYQNQATAAMVAASRRNKPSYGMVFSQMLDLHLLCTKQPRGRSRHGGGYGGYIWAVEVLLDELGVYEEGLETYLDGVGDGKERKKRLTRRSREQRWGAVEIEEGSGRVVDTF